MKTLQQLDREITHLAWDAELIIREAGAPVYKLLPASQSDDALAASIGASLGTELSQPVVVFQNDLEDT